MKTPRDYQLQCETAVFKEWDTVASTLVVVPTGGGKTFIAARIAQRMMPRRTMFVAHRRELIMQARNSIDDQIADSSYLFGSQYCEVEMGELYARHQQFAQSPVVAMVQSLNSKNGMGRRMERFNPMDFGLLVIDEAHHSCADSYEAVLNYFKRNPKLKILGLTATPDRADEEALGQMFETVAFDYEILDAIQDGWLVPVEQVMVPVKGLDFSHVKTTAGDLKQSDLAAVMEAESVIQGVVQPTLELMFRLAAHHLDGFATHEWHKELELRGRPRRTLVFTVSVAQAEMLSNIFNRVRDGLADWVCGKTPDNERADKLRRYDAGQTAIMVNCGVLLEGFDSPGVEVVVMARPTKSRALYAQCCGRATRPLPGLVDGIEDAAERRERIAGSAKPVMTVMDFCGNSGKHKLCSTVDILGGNVSDDALEKARKRMAKLGTPVSVVEALKEAEEDVRLELEARRRAEEARKLKVVARTNYSLRSVNPFDALDIVPVKARGWDQGKQLSAKQAALLQKQGVNPDGLPYAQARQLIAELFKRWDNKLASLKQCAILKRNHLPTNVSREQASKWLDAIAKNKWRRPADLVVPEAIGNAVPF